MNHEVLHATLVNQVKYAKFIVLDPKSKWSRIKFSLFVKTNELRIRRTLKR